MNGRLLRKNASLAEAEKSLAVENVEFSLHTRGKRSFWATEIDKGTKGASFYKAHFSQGATIVPRSFWFVQVKPSPLGFNPELPPLETADRARQEAKEAYKSVFFKGTVENRFLYATLLSTDLLPFGHLDYRLVILPIEPKEDHYELFDSTKARKNGFLHLARWLERAEQEWTKRRSTKAERITALGWLDYRRKLTTQNPQAKYRVIYPDVNRVMLASVVPLRDQISFNIEGQTISVKSLLVDYTTYFLETNSEDEAMFIGSVLNSQIVDSCLKPFRRRGQKAHPHVVKKIFDVAPVPQFDERNATHRRLAQLGKKSSTKVEYWLAGGGAGNIKSIGRLRGMVRVMLKDELKKIDMLVEKILG